LSKEKTIQPHVTQATPRHEAERVKYVMQFYEKVTRYTTSTFLRMKLGDELAKREVAPHLYESKDEAHRRLKE